MSDFVVIDKKGTWVRNTGEFALPDYPRGNETPSGQMVMLQPGVPTKVNVSAYLASQPMLQYVDIDPITGDALEVPTPATAPAEAPAPAADAAKPAVDTGKKK